MFNREPFDDMHMEYRITPGLPGKNYVALKFNLGIKSDVQGTVLPHFMKYYSQEPCRAGK